MALITAAIKRVLPDPVVKAIRTYRGRSKPKEFAGLTNQEVFTKIYEEGAWGQRMLPDRHSSRAAGRVPTPS